MLFYAPHRRRLLAHELSLAARGASAYKAVASLVTSKLEEESSMKIELDGGGKVKMAAPPQQWHGDEVMQTAVFAGEQMMAVTDDAGRFDLHYLGFKTTGFASLEDAKASAQAFARAVLAHMAGLI